MELQSIKDECLFLKGKNAHSWPILLKILRWNLYTVTESFGVNATNREA